MYNKKESSINVSFETIYGFISKIATFYTINISTVDILDKYLTQVFLVIKTAIIEDFKELEKANKIEVLDE